MLLSRLFHGRIQPVVQTVRRFHTKDDAIVSHLRSFFVCDVEAELNDIPSLEKRFSERGYKPQIDLRDLKELYALLRRQTVYHIKLQTALLEMEQPESNIDEKRKKPTVFKPFDQTEESEQKKYYLLQQINDFEKCYLRLRTYVLYHCFKFPNELHPDTPKDADRVIWSNVPDNVVGQDHVEVGHRLGVLEYSSPVRYFLLNEAANVEIAVQRYVGELLSDELSFKSFRNPDTCHDLIMEGIYSDDSENEGFVLENSRYRLVGGASFPAFCAYKTGASAHMKFLPERFFSCGRRYLPPTNDSDRGLYSVNQRSNVQAIVATSTEEEIHTEYERMLEWLISLYERLGANFRVCNTRAAGLHRGESLRTRLQLYSAHRREFIDAAHISFVGDYTSQRLNIINHDKDENYFTTWLLEISVLSIPILLANFLEKSTDKMFVPDCLMPYIYKTPGITS